MKSILMDSLKSARDWVSGYFGEWVLHRLRS